jgi:predicted O-methyltransferase YrrM
VPSTSTTEPVAGALRRLHAEAARSRDELQARRAAGPVTDAAVGSSEYWAALREVHFAVSPQAGRLLYLLARTRRAQAVIEFGTSFGVSTMYLAAAVRDNGGGKIIGSEFESTKAVAAAGALAAAGLEDLVDIRVGDALETLRGDLPSDIDMVLLDGTKTIYLQGLLCSRTTLRPMPSSWPTTPRAAPTTLTMSATAASTCRSRSSHTMSGLRTSSGRSELTA